MNDQDAIQYEILEDGTIKFTTDPVSAVNHASAEEFLRTVSRLAGGETTRVRRTDAIHTHEHGEHTHDHEHNKQ